MRESLACKVRGIGIAPSEADAIMRCYQHAAHYVVACVLGLEDAVPVFDRHACEIDLPPDTQPEGAALILLAGAFAEEVTFRIVGAVNVGAPPSWSERSVRKSAAAREWIGFATLDCADPDANDHRWTNVQRKARDLVKKLRRFVDRVATATYERETPFSVYDGLILLEHDSEEFDACYQALTIPASN